MRFLAVSMVTIAVFSPLFSPLFADQSVSPSSSPKQTAKTPSTPQNSTQIDLIATAEAPWLLGSVVAKGDYNGPIYRKFLGITTEGFYLVQDHYADHVGQTRTEPFLLMRKTDLHDFCYAIDDEARYQKYCQKTGFTGPLITYYQNGKLHVMGDYQNGTRVNLWRSWYPSGELKRLANFDEKGHKEGEYREYYQNGKLSAKGVYRADQKTGFWVTWYQTGQLKTEKQYQNGVPNGQWLERYPSGELAKRATYQNGTLVEPIEYWSETGEKTLSDPAETELDALKEQAPHTLPLAVKTSFRRW
ncbi:toxin-antitoxin system YwqK family antitoxin [Ignatzschineria sp. RMDPL8A]|uniref:toxin-antitoxin system YwqK family antitoxin n=1 Tax=Ignatzschineria sp. RMDPL8A TaxID=2999236 RepID=UPI0024466152|nr:toxin-antitoxin system YwqK family antitoxin [Ignatzschineria sp. RMDPL8A]MDG9730240.1 toxin-antitoxin system YwqK family antitoxin [Ignatzschineria sp. RMDPL8A]